MDFLSIKDTLSKHFPFIELVHGTDNNCLIFKNIISSKRFDMGCAWDSYIKFKDNKIEEIVYHLRTYDNVRANFSQEMSPTKEVEQKMEKILDLLNITIQI